MTTENKTAQYSELVALLQLKSDQEYSILDFGCGYGGLLSHMSENVSPNSLLVGVDSAEGPISWARDNYEGIEFRQSKFIDALCFPDSSFDIVVSLDTLECIPDKDGLLQEFARVLKPNGQLLIAHWDWDTQVYSSNHKEIVRQLVACFADWQQGWMDACDGQMGRKLWGIAQRSGLFDGKMHCFTLLETEFAAGQFGFDRLSDVKVLVQKGEVSSTDYELITDEMHSLHELGEYFYSINSYVYLGRKVETRT